MKTLVLGFDCAAPELLFGDEQLVHVRRLMELGCYGELESVVPPITVPAWMCMAASQDPGSLGVYGFRNRLNRSYDKLGIVTSRSIDGWAVWDQVAREGKRAHVIGVPPNYPPRKINGVSVGCFLTPDTRRGDYTQPPDAAEDIARLVGEYPVDVRGFRTNNKSWLKQQIYELSRKQFAVARHFIQRGDWDYLQFVEIGLDRLHHGFWKFHDPEHRLHEPGHPLGGVIRDYYRHLDEQLGMILELLDDETAVLVLSDHGAKRLDGGFCVNQWLVEEGLLALHHQPREVTPPDRLDIDWDRTTAWSEGGYYARVFLNVAGREPRGTIDPGDYEKVRDDIKSRLEALPDDRGRPMQTRVFKPEEVYREVRNIAPDLIVHFGDLHWRSIGGVGYDTLHVQENDTGPDDCNHAQMGSFLLAAPGLLLEGEFAGAHLMDMSPTLLELCGYDVPGTMQGRSLVSSHDGNGAAMAAAMGGDDDEELIRQRLRGLGYI